MKDFVIYLIKLTNTSANDMVFIFNNNNYCYLFSKETVKEVFH
ncbi:hypothetical protein CBFG_01677 [Clostridiales bacterium 1_7_47FAA]|nr:hypothetical protein CBFG_01677 [Clostridiales bacterium 1_7_47FAA]